MLNVIKTVIVDINSIMRCRIKLIQGEGKYIQLCTRIRIPPVARISSFFLFHVISVPLQQSRLTTKPRRYHGRIFYCEFYGPKIYPASYIIHVHRCVYVCVYTWRGGKVRSNKSV